VTNWPLQINIAKGLWAVIDYDTITQRCQKTDCTRTLSKVLGVLAKYSNGGCQDSRTVDVLPKHACGNVNNAIAAK